MARKKKIDLNAAPTDVPKTIWRMVHEDQVTAAKEEQEPWKTISMLTRAGFKVGFSWGHGGSFDPEVRGHVICSIYPLERTNKMTKNGTGDWLASKPRNTAQEAWEEVKEQLGKLDTNPASRTYNVGHGEEDGEAVSGISN